MQSFTSSNSSFTECVRNHIQLLHTNDNTPETLLNGTLMWNKKDFLPQDHTSLPTHSSSSTSFQFSDCSFTNCYYASSGGAISLDNSYSSLLVEKSSFTGCNVPMFSDGPSGGAISCRPCYSVSISYSSFISCKGSKGGGVYLWGISFFCSVSGCVFTQCEAKDWGNALLLRELPSINGGNTNTNNNNHPPACSLCRFLHNEHRVVTSGAIYFLPSYGAHTLKENLYTSNNADHYGGAVEYNVDGNYQVTCAIFYFNFFSDNNAKGNGDDVVFTYNDKYSTWSPFFHCFSTTTSNRVAFAAGSTPYRYNDTWLPQTNF